MVIIAMHCDGDHCNALMVIIDHYWIDHISSTVKGVLIVLLHLRIV